MTAQSDLRERYNWKRVEAPRPWRPKPGEELIGFYGGKTTRTGPHGQYEVVMVFVPNRGAVYITGVQIINAVDASGIHRGWPMRIIYGGEIFIEKSQRTMRTFDVFVAEGDRLPEEELPEVPSLQ